MKQPQWIIVVLWPEGGGYTLAFPNTEMLKRHLDQEAFCTKHRCTMPKSVTIKLVG